MDLGWERYDENFDQYPGGGNGGALYVRDNGDDTYDVAGVIWLDDLGDAAPYAALVSRFVYGEGYDISVTDKYSAADAFQLTLDSNVVEEFGEYFTIEEAVQAVEDAIEGARM